MAEAERRSAKRPISKVRRPITGIRGGAFVGEHGSWNLTSYNGYCVVFLRFAGGRPVGKPMRVVAGFIGPDGKARGRPVGVAVDRDARCSSPMMSATRFGE